MTANLFSGLGQDYSGTIPAGQVGFWCSHGTANSFDNFYIRDLAGPFKIDGAGSGIPVTSRWTRVIITWPGWPWWMPYWGCRSYPKTVLSSNSVQPRCRKP